MSPRQAVSFADSKPLLLEPRLRPPPGGSSTTVHTRVDLDGRQIATVVSRHQAAAANGPASSGSAFDARQSFTQPGSTGAW